MKILVIGGGGREHALAWRLAQAARVQVVYVAPGNAGTAFESGVKNVDIIATADLIAFAHREQIYLTIVGPETSLADGIVNDFRAAGLKIFGPTRAAAQLESSKEFAKKFMVRHNIPTASYQAFESVADACAYVEKNGAPVVIKADGLAAGKGVVVAMTVQEACDAIAMMLSNNKFGEPGVRLIIEEFIVGKEASFIVMVDGDHALPLATSQDHKRLLDGDCGPNTGGMGAYSPAPMVTPELHARVLREVIMPVIRGMKEEGNSYTGFLYAGLMIDSQSNYKVLEFNCRMGDPETQPIMLRLKSDLLMLLEHAVEGTLNKVEAEWDRRAALGVVLAAANYPSASRKDDVITGLPKTQEDAHVFHAGTRLLDGRLVTSGGRVLCVTALGDSVVAAQRRAYQIAEEIYFDGCQMRHDIGHQAVPPKGRTPTDD